MGDSTDQHDFPYSEFTPVRSRKKRRQGRPSNKESPGTPALLQSLRTQIHEDNWLSKSLLAGKPAELIDTALASYSFPVTEILCLGLGSPSLSLNARVQLAFLLALCDHLHIDYAKVAIYDPVFEADDLALLESLQMRPLTENRARCFYLLFQYRLTQPTICFMPHCDLELYENIIKTNWNRDNHLSNLFFIANRFADYVER
ncbi:SRR1-domain-containing protein [Pluteus cervinus]|uniref:SRR1-domain-containing protein n=1 Tax=Pluteus cervinus TaxID=181527 RepID=A0ACD3B3G6_9AGAR|nr:SRR1-domain-containing protein [Pluteus cervinus]